MTYFKVDDGFWSHPKFFDMPDASVVLWVKAGSYCCQHLTDGFVEAKTIRMIHCDPEAARALVDAGLWVEVEGGFQFHDWTDHQRSSESVKRDRAATRERQRAFVARRRAASGGVSDVEAVDNVALTLVDNSLNDDESNGVSDDRSNVVDGKGKERKGIYKDHSSKNLSNDLFEEFWKTYPRRVGKTAARRAFVKAVASGVTAETVIAGARAYADDPNREPEFTAHPSTWLNAGRWDDEPLPGRSVTKDRLSARRDAQRAVIEHFAELDGIGKGMIEA